MSRNLTINEQASFDARVKQAYQGSGLLRSTVELADNIVGATHRFHKIGRGMATKRIDQTDVIPMNIMHGNATAVLEDWNAAEYTGIFNQQKVPYKEQDKLAYIIASAIGRREDQLILDALDASATTNVVDTAVGGAASGMNTAKLRRAKALMDATGVPKVRGERFLVISAAGLEELLGTTEVTSSDYNTVKALYDGEVNYWLGFEIIQMEDRAEGGLPKSGNVRTSYAYHKAAVGLAVGINFRTEVNYIPVKTSYLANGIFSGGAVAIDPEGIVEIETTEAA